MSDTSTISNPGAADVPPRRRRRGVIAVLLGLTTISLGAGMFSLALFTDSAASSGSFATGTIDIDASPVVAFNVTGMFPGDDATQALTIDNDGSGQLRYALTVAATDALGAALTLEIREEGTDCATFDGATVLYTTALDGAAFGDPTAGYDAGTPLVETGDRTLDALTSEVLCFRVSLPVTADDTVQGETSAATFTFDAEQTANNP